MSLAYLTPDIPGIGGLLKQSPEDFEVEEIPAYPPSGEGDHLFLWIEKRDLSADQLLRHLSRTLELPARDIGMAGLKDRRAVTRQYVSVPAQHADRLPAIETEQVHVLTCTRHPNKLRTGHLRGNRFSILLRHVDGEALQRAHAIADRLRAVGFPNYYGDQRFGAGGETLTLGLDLLRGRTTPADIPASKRRFLLRLALSAVQSDLFNQALHDRLTDDLFQRVLAGDVMQVVASGGPFVVEEVDREQQRFEQRETVITGPLFGPKMKKPLGEPARREAELRQRAELQESAFLQFRKLIPGSRRPYVIWPEDLAVEAENDGLRFRFTLASGVYATTLLREFQKSQDDTPPEP